MRLNPVPADTLFPTSLSIDPTLKTDMYTIQPFWGLLVPYLTKAVSSAGAEIYPANGTAAAGAIHSGGGEMSSII